jgi:hypothetical protein
MTLDAFSGEMQPMLLGRASAAAVEARLGRSPSGTTALAFYAVLVSRNAHKILREICPTLFVFAARAGAWSGLVHDYLAAHPPRGGDPNRFADALPEFLERRARQHGDVPQLWAELADYHVVQVRAHQAADGEGDGFDRRLFVRQYTHPIPEIVERIARDPAVAIASPRPTLVVVFRHARTLHVRRLVPSAAGLAALARRQGLALPPALAGLPDAEVVAAERALIREGVLPSRLSTAPELPEEDDYA